MTAWETGDVAAALPDATETLDVAAVERKNPQEAGLVAVERKNPQEAGWVAAKKYDYDTYNKSTKEQAEAREAAGQNDAEAELAADADADAEPETLAVGGLRPGEWASSGAVYEWDEEYGDVGPAFPDLEDMLFGKNNNHVRQGLNFEKYLSSFLTYDTLLTRFSITTLTVTQEGTIKIDPIRKFEDAGLHPCMLRNVQLAGYHVPTPIQQYCLPAVKKDHDVVACAQTGTF